MNSTTQIIAHFFLFALSFGTQLFSSVVSTELTGVGFYKLGTSIVLVSLMLTLGIDLSMSPSLTYTDYFCYGTLILTNAITYIFHKDKKSILMWMLYLLQIFIFAYFSFVSFDFQPVWIQVFFFCLALLGISNFAMILGHYYLVVPKLSVEPLIYCLFIFWTVILVRFVFSLTTIFSTGMPYLTEGSTLGDGYMFNWIFISMRYLWGYLAPFILSLFTFRLCKMRSTQSATGVLYIIEFFVIVGELLSIYLLAKHGLAL